MKKKVGLVLGGGGAKGAYQIGVYKALKEFGLVDEIEAISGTSIGALNLALLSLKEVEKAEDIWVNLSKRKVLTLKKWNEYFNFKNFSLLSRKGMLEIFSSDIDFKRVSNCQIPLYVCATNEDDNIGESFKLNGCDEQRIIDIISASSAIPTIFPSVKIDGKTYSDGYVYRNVPISTLEEYEHCNFLYVVPLSTNGAPKEGDYPDITIIDFNERQFFDLNILEGTLNFDKEVAEQRIALGYNNAVRLLTFLRKKGVICITKKEKFFHFLGRFNGKNKRLKKYYSLADIDPLVVRKEV